MKNAVQHQTMIRAIFALLALGVALVVLGFVIIKVWSALNAVGAVAQELSQKRLEVDQTSRAAVLAQETQAARADLALLAAPADGGDVALIANIESLATTSKVLARVTAIGGKGPIGTTPGSLALTLEFSGTFAACLRYLKLIETSPVAGHIQTVALQYAASANGWTGTVTFFTLSFDTPS